VNRNRLVCPQCNGSQVQWYEEVLADCGRCLGRGWVSLPGELFRPQVIGAGAFILGFTLAIVVLVGTGLA
jgi:hypothetical protein